MAGVDFPLLAYFAFWYGGVDLNFIVVAHIDQYH